MSFSPRRTRIMGLEDKSAQTASKRKASSSIDEEPAPKRASRRSFVIDDSSVEESSDDEPELGVPRAGTWKRKTAPSPRIKTQASTSGEARLISVHEYLDAQDLIHQQKNELNELRLVTSNLAAALGRVEPNPTTISDELEEIQTRYNREKTLSTSLKIELEALRSQLTVMKRAHQGVHQGRAAVTQQNRELRVAMKKLEAELAAEKKKSDRITVEKDGLTRQNSQSRADTVGDHARETKVKKEPIMQQEVELKRENGVRQHVTWD
ncbi:hypothetical protein BDZ85DRAFT_13711 [Elsinoe ampelina]|uniref:Uncharacterized protein n=1 Tax=Elsinoe ampelina TaxID=302913 RepID=A0A6A6GR71_9PEZI|nr:hypothetical protein BDZ85DRAFT_13711 [Elsinoe ampelina]